MREETKSGCPEELVAMGMAREIADLVNDLGAMKSLFCALSYALAQFPDRLLDYLRTFRRLAEIRSDLSPEEYEEWMKMNDAAFVNSALERRELARLNVAQVTRLWTGK